MCVHVVHNYSSVHHTYVSVRCIPIYVIRLPHQTIHLQCARVVCISLLFCCCVSIAHISYSLVFVNTDTLAVDLIKTKRFCITNIPTIKSRELLQRAEQLLFIIHEYISTHLCTVYTAYRENGYEIRLSKKVQEK